MIRTAIVSMALIAGLLTVFPVVPPVYAGSSQAAGQVSAADASPFLGEWILALQSQDGPREYNLTVKVEKDKVIADITGGGMATQPITDVTRTDKSLVLRYAFDYQGTAVDAAVSLTPEIDFAGGAYVMSGIATRKDKAK